MATPETPWPSHCPTSWRYAASVDWAVRHTRRGQRGGDLGVRRQGPLSSSQPFLGQLPGNGPPWRRPIKPERAISRSNRPDANASGPGGTRASRYSCGPPASSRQTRQGSDGPRKVETSVRVRLAPLRRSGAGANVPIRGWLHYADHGVAPMCVMPRRATSINMWSFLSRRSERRHGCSK